MPLAVSPLLLFDLGGVLVETSALTDIRALLRDPLSDTEILAVLTANEAQDASEKGLLSPEEFGEAFLKSLPLTVDIATFLGQLRIVDEGDAAGGGGSADGARAAVPAGGAEQLERAALDAQRA